MKSDSVDDQSIVQTMLDFLETVPVEHGIIR
jgi:hypothetical protein